MGQSNFLLREYQKKYYGTKEYTYGKIILVIAFFIFLVGLWKRPFAYGGIVLFVIAILLMILPWLREKFTS